jgi:hypothetical protein
MNIKSLLWRVVYAVILVVILIVIVPLLFQMVGISIPTLGPAITLLKFAFACLILIYVFFGPDPPAPF